MENNIQPGWKSGAKPIPEPQIIELTEEELNDLMIKKVENDD